MKTKKTLYKISPYLPYEIEEFQHWLQEMAQEGWHLKKDGFFMGVVSFEKGEKKKVRYRFEASMKSTSMWAENNGEPDEEAVDLNQLYGWEYIAKCKDFYIYRCENEECRELNTDPKVQEMALKEVCKRQSSTLFTIIFWLAVYLWSWIRSSFFLTMIQIGTVFFLIGEVLMLLILLDLIKEIVRLNRLRKKLKNGQLLLSEKTIGKRQGQYFRNFILYLMLMIWGVILLAQWNEAFIHKQELELNEKADLTFATMIDFVQDEDAGYQETLKDLNMNGIKSWTDLLAPVNYQYAEHAVINLKNQQALSGGLRIDYHETINEFLAKQVALEYVRFDQKEKDYEELNCPQLNADYAIAYMNHLHFQTVVIQKKNKVIHASFYQTGPVDLIQSEEWMSVLSESLD